MTASLEITGFAAVDNALSSFPKKFRDKAVKGALKDGMKTIVLRDAKRMTPKDSGQLEKSLKVRTAKGKGGKRLPRNVVGFQVEAVKTKRINAFYASFVFLGARNRDGSKRPGTKTLRRALYGNSSAFKAYVVGKLRADMPRIAREVKVDSLRYKG